MTLGLPTLMSAALLLAQPAPSTVPPATAPATLPSADLSALVAQLLGTDAAQRDAARQAILSSGEDALPALKAARAVARDPDAQMRLDTLLVQVKERADVGATRVTLQFTDAPIDVVLESLGKQARAEFGGENLVNELGGREGLPRVTLDLRDVTFWRALQEVQEAANIVFFPQPDGWRVTRNFGQPRVARGSESGAFLVQPMSASYSRMIAYAPNMGNGGENFTLQFQTYCEPKVKLAPGTGTVRLERAVDSNGNDLLSPQRVNQISLGNGQNPITCNIPLKYPKNAGATIAEIRGTLKISLARRTEQLSSEDLLTDRKVEATIEGVKVRVEVSGDESARGSVSLTVTIDSAGDVGAAQRLQQNFQSQVHLADAKGSPLRVTNFTPVRTDARGSEFRMTFTSPQPARSSGPYKLRIDVPTAFRELDVPFVMRDMKMP